MAFVLGLLALSELLVLLHEREKGSPPKAEIGFLIKNGPEYLFVWRSAPGMEYRAVRFAQLIAAQAYIEKLGLSLGRDIGPRNQELERLWMTGSGEDRTLFWKLKRFPFSHRLTFQSSVDAAFFYSAFEGGHYRPSPFGHSIFFSATDVSLSLR